MSEPRRLGLDPSSDLERTLLASARARAPHEARQRAVLAASAAMAASGLAAGTATAGSGFVAKLGSALAVHWIAVSGVVGLAAISAAVVIDHHQGAPSADSRPVETRRVPSAGPVPSHLATTAVGTPAPDTVTPTAPETSASSAGLHTPTPASTASSVAAELAYLEQARAALSSGDAAHALSILDQYGSRFPRASMAPEATMLRIESLIAAGDRDAAQRTADAFLAGHPTSPYATRIRSLLGTNP